MTRTRRFLTSALVTAMLSLHGCYFGFSSGGGDCYPYCYNAAKQATLESLEEVQTEPAYDDVW